jgi:signal transduction histidine kinase
MRVEDFLQDVSWALYVLIFVLVAVRAARRPTRAHLDMTLFFGVVALIIALSAFTAAVFPRSPPAALAGVTASLLLALPHLLLRLVEDFTRVPKWVLRASAAGLVLSVLAVFVSPTPIPRVVALALVAYFVVVVMYDSWAFVRAAQRGRGVTRRRMQAVAAGSGCLALVLLLAGVGVADPAAADAVDILGRIGGLASGVCYFVGFAPPTWLRRAWQEPELRNFLRRAASLPRLPDLSSIIRELEQGAVESLGGSGSSLGLWDEAAGVLHFFRGPPPEGRAEPVQGGSYTAVEDIWELDPRRHPISGRAFLDQRALLVRDVQRADPPNAALYSTYEARSALAAPISVGSKRLGVLVVYAAREPLFANSDLELIRLLADQAAVVLESRALIEEAARVRAREEATRLKEDFLSSAAHDLKTPLTGMLSQAQLMQRRALRNPSEPADQVGIERLVREARRLKTLVLELLDAARFDSDTVTAIKESVDLAGMAREVCARERSYPSSCAVTASESVVGAFDPVRMRQLLENLVDNAAKYSPRGGAVGVEVWREGDVGRIAVRDQGIGIPPHDMPSLFERFHRGSNVDDRHFAGLGLGLYICRQIVIQHGGRIWAESTLGQGSTFHVELPLTQGALVEPSQVAELAGA